MEVAVLCKAWKHELPTGNMEINRQNDDLCCRRCQLSAVHHRFLSPYGPFIDSTDEPWPRPSMSSSQNERVAIARYRFGCPDFSQCFHHIGGGLLHFSNWFAALCKLGAGGCLLLAFARSKAIICINLCLRGSPLWPKVWRYSSHGIRMLFGMFSMLFSILSAFWTFL